MPDFFDFVGGIVSSSGSGTSASIAAAVSYVLGVIASVASQILKIIKVVANFLYGILKDVVNFLNKLWTGFFKKIFTNFFKGILRLHDWLESKLGPVIAFLKKLRAWYDKFYKQWVRPVLNTIQHIRRVLLILRALHVKWATALDKRLFDIEAKIAGVFLTIRGHLNAAIDLLNLIVDPEKLLRHPAIIISIRRSIGGIFRATTGYPIGFFFPSNGLTASSEEAQIDACRYTPAKPGSFTITEPPPLLDGEGSSFLESNPLDPESDSFTAPAPLAYFSEANYALLSCLFSPDESTVIFGDAARDIATVSGNTIKAAGAARSVFLAAMELYGHS